MGRPYLGIDSRVSDGDHGDEEQYEQSASHGGAQRCFGQFLCRQSEEKKLTRSGEWHEKAVAAGAGFSEVASGI